MLFRCIQELLNVQLDTCKRHRVKVRFGRHLDCPNEDINVWWQQQSNFE